MNLDSNVKNNLFFKQAFYLLQVKFRARLKERQGHIEIATIVSELILQGVKTRLSQLTGGALVSRMLDNILTDLLHREKTRMASDISAALKTRLNSQLKNYNLGLSLQFLQNSDKYIRRGSLY